jgi:hypothetical protein
MLRFFTSKSIRAEILAAAGCIACCAAGPAIAHGFGQRYDLPLPLSLYLVGAAAAVAFTFLVAAIFVRGAPAEGRATSIDLCASSAGSWLARVLATLLEVASVGLFTLTIVAGLRGNQNPYQNIAPTLTWIVGWVGLAYVCAFFGDLWQVINPWRALFAWAAALYRRLGGGRELSLGMAYPARLGVWPAFALLLAFAWIELVYPSPAMPAFIARLLIAYSILTWGGMLVFGAQPWLRQAELFSVFFGTLARLAPTRIAIDEPSRRCRWTLRPFASGLQEEGAVSTSMTAFVLLMLATVLYDGILATPEWTATEAWLAAHGAGVSEAATIAVRSAGLVACWFFFLATYVAVSALVSLAVPGRPPTWGLARSFVLTLVPIAIGYHVAHYLVYLLVQGQYIVPLLSDPLGRGWDVLGTAGYRVDIAIVGARFAWYTAVIAVLVGHVVAVFLAHARATRLFESRRVALRSQIPLTALMMGYTFVSLSILAEPITERRVPASAEATSSSEIRIPEKALLPEAGSGRLAAVGPGKTARQVLTYRMLGSSFHDGTRTTMADLLYAYAFAYRWGERGAANSSHYDPFVDAASEVLRRRLAGVRVVGTDTASKSFRVGDIDVVRELLVLDVYTASLPEDPDQDAAVAPPWSTVPWHLLVLMEEAVERGWAAFSREEAQRRGVPWLDLVRDEALNRKLAALVETFARDGYRPPALEPLVSVEEARKRWAALAEFHRAHGHFLVTNGPYRLKSWSDTSVGLEVFRDLSYPLGVGSYDSYAIPRRGFITAVETKNGRVRLLADIETVSHFQRSYEIVRQALASMPEGDRKRAAPECRYVVIDAQGHAASAGVVQPGEDAAFIIDFAGKLAPGDYTMLAEITVNENAMNAQIKRIPLSIAE